MLLSFEPLATYLHGRPSGAPGWSKVALSAGFALLGCAALALWRRWPLPVLGWTVVLLLVATPVTGITKITSAPITVALFTVSIRRDWPTWLIAAAGTGLATGCAEVAAGSSVPSAIGGLVWVVAPVAVGVAVRNRRAYVAAIEDRAVRAEQGREDEARRRVAEERLRIARELHDVLAHSISVITIQSGMAAHLIHQQPARAQQALWHINDASRAALAELRATIGVLRDGDEPAAPTGPIPDLGQLEELVEQVRATGLSVRTHLMGDLSRVPPEIGLVGYRVLQEALTNVLKHAHAGTVEVTATTNGRQLRLDIHDDGVGAGAAASTVDGHGRIGMRERVHALGGMFQDGPAERGYRVHAVIPLGATGGAMA
jgi:signal transduction histidine kinase